MTCVYWEGEDQTASKVDASAGEEAEASRWSVKGCWVAYSDENYTICSCSHLSTFALILQIGDVRTKQPTLSRVDCSMCRLGSLDAVFSSSDRCLFYKRATGAGATGVHACLVSCRNCSNVGTHTSTIQVPNTIWSKSSP